MADPGRPDKFTPERRAAIIDSISHAIPYEYAAEANGICEATLYNWLIRGRKDQMNGVESEYVKFLEDIKKTEEARIKKHLEKLSEGADKWQSNAWILERRWWKHFGNSAAAMEFNERLKKLE